MFLPKPVAFLWVLTCGFFNSSILYVSFLDAQVLSQLSGPSNVVHPSFPGKWVLGLFIDFIFALWGVGVVEFTEISPRPSTDSRWECLMSLRGTCSGSELRTVLFGFSLSRFLSPAPFVCCSSAFTRLPRRRAGCGRWPSALASRCVAPVWPRSSGLQVFRSHSRRLLLLGCQGRQSQPSRGAGALTQSWKSGGSKKECVDAI